MKRTVSQAWVAFNRVNALLKSKAFMTKAQVCQAQSCMFCNPTVLLDQHGLHCLQLAKVSKVLQRYTKIRLAQGDHSYVTGITSLDLYQRRHISDPLVFLRAATEKRIQLATTHAAELQNPVDIQEWWNTILASVHQHPAATRAMSNEPGTIFPRPRLHCTQHFHSKKLLRYQITKTHQKTTKITKRSQKHRRNIMRPRTICSTVSRSEWYAHLSTLWT